VGEFPPTDRLFRRRHPISTTASPPTPQEQQTRASDGAGERGRAGKSHATPSHPTTCSAHSPPSIHRYLHRYMHAYLPHYCTTSPRPSSSPCTLNPPTHTTPPTPTTAHPSFPPPLVPLPKTRSSVRFSPSSPNLSSDARCPACRYRTLVMFSKEREEPTQRPSPCPAFTFHRPSRLCCACADFAPRYDGDAMRCSRTPLPR